MRIADRFLQEKGLMLGQFGFQADEGIPSRQANGSYLVYHYTRAELLTKVLEEGLYSRLPVVASQDDFFANHYLIEGFLEPYPKWLAASRYFGDFCLSMMRRYVGTTLLEIEIPGDVAGVFVAEMAHNFSCKFLAETGKSALDIGYDCATGKEVVQAELNSYIDISKYSGGHILPNVKITRLGEGIAVPAEWLKVSEVQPLQI